MPVATYTSTGVYCDMCVHTHAADFCIRYESIIRSYA